MNELNSDFDFLSAFGTNSSAWANYDGELTELPDGTLAGYRPQSSGKSGYLPTIDILFPDDPTMWKAHVAWR